MDDIHFVVSAPRSGSTWLTKALNGHPEILATECRLFGMFCEVWQNSNGRSSARITADQYLRTFSNHSFYEDLGFESAAEMQQDLLPSYLTFLAGYLRAQSGKPIIVDKITPYLGTAHRVCSEIKNYFPSAAVIHLIRDGRDVATSGVFDWIARQNHQSDRYRLFVKRDPSVVLKRFFNEALLSEWTSYWREPIEAFRGEGSTTVEVRYEAMLADQAKVLASIFAGLGLPHDAEVANQAVEGATFSKTTGRQPGKAQPLSKARKGVAGDWRNYFTRDDAQLFVEMTGDWLLELGYEENLDWIDSCPVELSLSLGS